MKEALNEQFNKNNKLLINLSIQCCSVSRNNKLLINLSIQCCSAYSLTNPYTQPIFPLTSKPFAVIRKVHNQFFLQNQ